MISTAQSLARRAVWQWTPRFAMAGACALLAACGSEFAAGTPSADTPPDCAATRLGCATEHNIAALAARPSDLIVPRKETPRDAGRRDAMLSAYRQNGSRAQGPATANTTLQGEISR